MLFPYKTGSLRIIRYSYLIKFVANPDGFVGFINVVKLLIGFFRRHYLVVYQENECTGCHRLSEVRCSYIFLSIR